jgi:hypothetical protein
MLYAQRERIIHHFDLQTLLRSRLRKGVGRWRGVLGIANRGPTANEQRQEKPPNRAFPHAASD